MEMISRISSPVSESWVAWVLLLLVVLWLLNSMFVPEISMVFRGLFSRGERTYLSNGSQLQYTTWGFRVGLVALLVQMLLVKGEGFAFADYGIILGVVSLAYLVQELLIRLVGVVFVSHRVLEGALDQRTLINNALCGMLPLVVLLLGVEPLGMIVLFVLLSLYVGMLLIKSVQLFYRNILSILYILLYIISLELIPMVGTILWIKNIL
jgi:hypothetical protein